MDESLAKHGALWHTHDMPKRSSNPEDHNVLATHIVREATGDKPSEPWKNPAAVELGRLGGLKGGKARAKKLSAARRKQIAKKGARARWRKKS